MAVHSPGPGDFNIPDALPILPLRDAVMFPLTAVPLAVGQPRSVRLVDDVMRGNRLLALVAQRDPATEPAREPGTSSVWAKTALDIGRRSPHRAWEARRFH